MTITAEQRRAAIELVQTVAEVIRTAEEIPSGELYAQMMGKIDLRTYERMIGMLKGAGLVEEKYHILRWVGPKFDEEGKRV